jgi:hypothetical protein
VQVWELRRGDITLDKRPFEAEIKRPEANLERLQTGERRGSCGRPSGAPLPTVRLQLQDSAGSGLSQHAAGLYTQDG